jgi:hypothetical protein
MNTMTENFRNLHPRAFLASRIAMTAALFAVGVAGELFYLKLYGVI